MFVYHKIDVGNIMQKLRVCDKTVFPRKNPRPYASYFMKQIILVTTMVVDVIVVLYDT